MANNHQRGAWEWVDRAETAWIGLIGPIFDAPTHRQEDADGTAGIEFWAQNPEDSIMETNPFRRPPLG